MRTSYSAGLVGVTGYTGMELTRLLANHPSLTLTRATSRAEAGRRLDDLYPFLMGLPIGDVRVCEPDLDELAKSCDVVFLAVPHSAAMDLAAGLLARGARVVDLSADFRLRDPAVYEAWYKTPHRHPELIGQAVYGLIEAYREKIPKARLVANPGCYPTSVILGLLPALEQGLVHPEHIVADCKSGATGAGRKASVPTLFCEVQDNFRAYNLAKHRHTPEIEQEASLAAGAPLTISFNTHLLPIGRGILSTIYATLKPGVTEEDVWRAYRARYDAEPWVRLSAQGSLPETRWVRGSMFCDLGLVVDPRTGRLIVVSAIDNLCRGASGQALACANLMLGLDMFQGLDAAPLAP